MTHIAETCFCGGSFDMESRFNDPVQMLHRQWVEKHRNCRPPLAHKAGEGE